MTTDPYPAPPSAPDAAPTRGGRALLAAALVFVGGYLVIAAFSGQLAAALAGFLGAGPAYTVLVVAQFVFAIVVVLTGLVAAPGSGIGKLVGAIVVVVGLAVVLAVSALRLTGALRLGVESFYSITNPWLMTVLLVGIAWLLVRRARLGWLALLGVIVLSPVPQWLVLANVDTGVVQLVMFALSAVVGAAILAAGRPWAD